MRDDGGGNHLVGCCEPLRDKFVAAGLTRLAQGVVAGQRRLAVQVQQQNAKARIGEHTAQVGGDGGFTCAALGRDQ
ncbi:hypothetical protein D3C76_872070 [compost metagenome]